MGGGRLGKPLTRTEFSYEDDGCINEQKTYLIRDIYDENDIKG